MTPDTRFDGQPLIPWAGGPRPVPGDTLVRVKWRVGEQFTCPAGDFDWSHFRLNSDILFYQVAKTEPVEAPETEKLYFWRWRGSGSWSKRPLTLAEIETFGPGDIQVSAAGPILNARIEQTTRLVIEGEG